MELVFFENGFSEREISRTALAYALPPQDPRSPTSQRSYLPVSSLEERRCHGRRATRQKAQAKPEPGLGKEAQFTAKETGT
jgi:hypothetical protein